MAFSYKDFQMSSNLTEAERRKKQYDADYSESSKVAGLYKDWLSKRNSKPAEWTGGQYSSQVDEALKKLLNRKDFTYDLNGDMLYQQYKDQYITQGKQAMMDTMGQAAALTGGYGNSYAQSVGQQTYQGYLQGLNDKIPELYQLALQKYQQEGDDLTNRYGLLKNEYDSEYSRYRDNVSDWNTDVDRAYNIYNNERGNEQSQYNTNREYASNAYNKLYEQEYGRYSDDYSRAFANYQQQKSEEQAAADLALERAKLARSNEVDSLKEQLASKDALLEAQDEKYKDYLSPEMQKAANSEAIQLFKASIMTKRELSRRNYTATVDGKEQRFDNYEQYIDAVAEKWNKERKLTEDETAYIIKYYGL